MAEQKLRHVDLFCGTGGFSLAFDFPEVETVYANDFSSASKIIFDFNFKNTIFDNNDMMSLSPKDIPKHDILTAGMSCQPYSIAGKQKGFEDERSNVFWKLIEIIKYHKPLCVVIENVKGLVSHNKGKTLETIINELEELNYNVLHKVLNTSVITKIPQNRERIFIVCFKNKTDADKFKFPVGDVKPKLPISSLLEKSVDEKYYYDLPKTNEKMRSLLEKSVVKENTIYQYRRVYVRENKNGVCPTLTANCGTGGHNVPIILDPETKRIRKLTPRECFNFQGFPATYRLPQLSDGKLYTLAGNAITVPLCKKLADNIIDVLW